MVLKICEVKVPGCCRAESMPANDGRNNEGISARKFPKQNPFNRRLRYPALQEVAKKAQAAATAAARQAAQAGANGPQPRDLLPHAAAPLPRSLDPYILLHSGALLFPSCFAVDLLSALLIFPTSCCTAVRCFSTLVLLDPGFASSRLCLILVLLRPASSSSCCTAVRSVCILLLLNVGFVSSSFCCILFCLHPAFSLSCF